MTEREKIAWAVNDAFFAAIPSLARQPMKIRSAEAIAKDTEADIDVTGLLVPVIERLLRSCAERAFNRGIGFTLGKANMPDESYQLPADFPLVSDE